MHGDTRTSTYTDTDTDADKKKHRLGFEIRGMSDLNTVFYLLADIPILHRLKPKSIGLLRLSGMRLNTHLGVTWLRLTAPSCMADKDCQLSHLSLTYHTQAQERNDFHPIAAKRKACFHCVIITRQYNQTGGI